MTQSQRSRYLKTGGILAFILFLFYVIGPSRGRVENVVKGARGLLTMGLGLS